MTASEKLLDLLRKFDLTDRLVSEENDLEQIFNKTIDFEKTDALREKERARSIDYLNHALSNR